MARIVIDASITLAWLFQEGEIAHRIKPILESAQMIAPSLWRLEVANVILIRERRKTITEAASLQMLQLIDELVIELIDEPAIRTATGLAQTARPHQLTAYDAVYLDLAIRSGLPLFTLDRNLQTAAQRVGVALIDVPTI